MSSKWNLDNVLPKYKHDPNDHSLYGNADKAHEPSKSAKRDGASAALLGGSSCPWCDAEMDQLDNGWLAVCRNNLEHIVEWLPWGG